MQAQVSSRRGGAAFIWKWGIIAGVILGVLHILIALPTLGLLGTLIDLVVWLVGFFVIGLFAARHTGRVGTGALAGLVTGLVTGLIGVLFGIVEIASNGAQFTQALNNAAQQAQQQGQNISSSELHTIAVVGIIIGLFITVAVELGLGAGIGALGGLVGRSQAPQAAAPYAESLWTPPPPAQPPGPNAPQE
ncbi:MAG TPA: hypothetical protein VKT82_24900 [Ktedonobacterales bacterium]|nr:hypothetical protein [Ktedonobacterales bacterium]